MVSYAKDLWGLWQDVTQDWRPGSSWRKIMIFWRRQQTYSWIWNVEPSWGRFALFEAKESLAHLSMISLHSWASQISPPPQNAFKIFPLWIQSNLCATSLKGLIKRWKVGEKCLDGFFCTNNAQAPSLFSNVTSRRTKLMVCERVSGKSALLQSNGTTSRRPGKPY